MHEGAEGGALIFCLFAGHEKGRGGVVGVQGILAVVSQDGRRQGLFLAGPVFCQFSEVHGGGGGKLGRGIQGAGVIVAPGELGVHPWGRFFRQMGKEIGKVSYLFPVFFFGRRKKGFCISFIQGCFFFFCKKILLAGDGEGEEG